VPAIHGNDAIAVHSPLHIVVVPQLHVVLVPQCCVDLACKAQALWPFRGAGRGMAAQGSGCFLSGKDVMAEGAAKAPEIAILLLMADEALLGRYVVPDAVL